MKNLLIASDGCYSKLDSGMVKGWMKLTSLSEVLARAEDLGEERKAELESAFRWTASPIERAEMAKVLSAIKEFVAHEIVLIIYRKETTGEWFIKAPPQKGSPASVDYEDKDESGVPEGYRFFGTIHSHPRMSAFWSGTDSRDQKDKLGIHIVVGTDSEGNMSSHKVGFSTPCGTYDLEGAVEWPEDGEISSSSVPEEWKEEIKAQRFEGTGAGFHDNVFTWNPKWRYEDWSTGQDSAYPYRYPEREWDYSERIRRHSYSGRYMESSDDLDRYADLEQSDPGYPSHEEPEDVDPILDENGELDSSAFNDLSDMLDQNVYDLIQLLLTPEDDPCANINMADADEKIDRIIDRIKRIVRKGGKCFHGEVYSLRNFLLDCMDNSEE